MPGKIADDGAKLDAGVAPCYVPHMPTSISRRLALLALSTFGLGASVLRAPLASAAQRQRLDVVLAIDPAGRPARTWLDVIRDRVSADELAEIAATARPLTPDEQGWADLVDRIAPVWFAGVAQLNAPFRHVTPPAQTQVVLGHGGGDDAFGAPPDIIAFDLSALAKAYADHDKAAREALMARLLSHEYTHLLVGPFLDSLGLDASLGRGTAVPLRAAGALQRGPRQYALGRGRRALDRAVRSAHGPGA